MSEEMRAPGEQPREHRLEVNGIALTAFEWPGDGPPLLLAHATGFHARCWDEVIRRLPGHRAWALDMRGHGRSEKPDEPYEWSRIGEDVVAFARAVDLHGAVGIGHSMGGHSVTYAAARVAGAFAALLLVDPVIGPRGAYRDFEIGRARGDTSFVARRRNAWSSPEEMVERFAGREPFSRWRPEVLRDYCAYGLVPAPDGDGLVLGCPPAVEAALYSMSMSSDIYADIERLEIPVRVLRARTPDPAEPAAPFSRSPTAPDLASHFRHGVDVYLPRATHFIPMEDPGLVAQHVRALLAGD